MARVIYLPGGSLHLEFESPLSGEVLALQVAAGEWQPPPGCPPPKGPLEAHACGNWVVIAAGRPGWTQAAPVPQPSATAASAVTAQPGARQLQVLAGLAAGFTTGRLALALGIRPSTVQYHISILHRLLGTATRAQLVRRATELGLLGKD